MYFNHVKAVMFYPTSDPFFRRFAILLFLGVLCYVIFLAKSVIIPFIVAFILAYALNPLVTLLSRIMRRSLAIFVVYVAGTLLLTMVLVWLIPSVWRQLQFVWESIPAMVVWYNEVARLWINKYTGSTLIALDLDVVSEYLVKYVQGNYQVSDARSLLKKILSSSLGIANILGIVVMVPILMVYFLLNWQGRLDALLNAVPKAWQPKTIQIAKDCDVALMSFIKGQLSVMFLLGCIYAGQLQLIGLKLGLIIGIGAGIASFVPYVGFGLGIICALVAGVVQFGLDPMYLGLIVGAFLVGQAMEGYVLQPLLLGDKIGLSALWVIFSVLAGASLLGFVGMLIALPVSAIINVLFRHAYGAYLQSDYYNYQGK